jgi:ABC-type transport system involved in cytochrome c biogenesis permease subunit
LQTILACIFIFRWEYGFLTYLLAFVWGLQDGAVNTHLQEISGFQFTPEENVKVFSIFTFTQCILVFLFLIIEAYITTRGSMYVFHIACGFLGMVMCGIKLWFPYKDPK